MLFERSSLNGFISGVHDHAGDGAAVLPLGGNSVGRCTGGRWLGGQPGSPLAAGARDYRGE